MVVDIPFMEVTGKRDVQNGGRSILKMTTGFRLFSSLSKVKIYFFLVFTSNLSYFNSFELRYKIQLLAFRFPLTEPAVFSLCTCRIQKYVKEQVLQVVAIICKRSILGNSQTIQESLLRDVTQLLTSNNRDMVGIWITY